MKSVIMLEGDQEKINSFLMNISDIADEEGIHMQILDEEQERLLYARGDIEIPTRILYL